MLEAPDRAEPLSFIPFTAATIEVIGQGTETPTAAARARTPRGRRCAAARMLDGGDATVALGAWAPSAAQNSHDDEKAREPKDEEK